VFQESWAQVHDVTVDVGPERRDICDYCMRNSDSELHAPALIKQYRDKEIEGFVLDRRRALIW